MSRGRLANYEQGQREAGQSELVTIAQFFGVTTDYLIHGSPQSGVKALYTKRKSVSSRKYIGVVGGFKDAQVVEVPILGRIRAGYDLYADEQVIGMYPVQSRLMSEGEEFFCLQVEGDSMTGDGIGSGDIILVRRQKFVDNGKIAAVILNGDEASLKRVWYHEDGTLTLQSSNPAYAPRTVRVDEVIVIGQAIHWYPQGKSL